MINENTARVVDLIIDEHMTMNTNFDLQTYMKNRETSARWIAYRLLHNLQL